MPEYRVMWEIELTAVNPEDAAKKAQEMQRDPQSTATVFNVRRLGKNSHIDNIEICNETIDLSECDDLEDEDDLSEEEFTKCWRCQQKSMTGGACGACGAEDPNAKD